MLGHLLADLIGIRVLFSSQQLKCLFIFSILPSSLQFKQFDFQEKVSQTIDRYWLVAHSDDLNGRLIMEVDAMQACFSVVC